MKWTPSRRSHWKSILKGLLPREDICMLINPSRIIYARINPCMSVNNMYRPILSSASVQPYHVPMNRKERKTGYYGDSWQVHLHSIRAWQLNWILTCHVFLMSITFDFDRFRGICSASVLNSICNVNSMGCPPRTREKLLLIRTWGNR